MDVRKVWCVCVCGVCVCVCVCVVCVVWCMCVCVQKQVPDLCWSPRCSTVFACVNEGCIEVWDLAQSTSVTFLLLVVIFAVGFLCSGGWYSSVVRALAFLKLRLSSIEHSYQEDGWPFVYLGFSTVHPAVKWVPALFRIREGKSSEGEEMGTVLSMLAPREAEVSDTSLPIDANPA